MPILNGAQIRQLVISNGLIRNPAVRDDGQASVEAASYDLRAGIVLWKNRSSGELEIRHFAKDAVPQPVVTLQPGQMVFVITHEDLRLPPNISGTVYSRNKLQKENILALNAGHIDPGYDGPIIIRLINLGAQGWPLVLGAAVFTVVFHTVEPDPDFTPGDHRTKEQTLAAASITAAHAFSNPFHDLYKDEIARQLNEHYSKAEHNIRTSLSKEFFRRDQGAMFVSAVTAIIMGGLALLIRIPWNIVFAWLKRIWP